MGFEGEGKRFGLRMTERNKVDTPLLPLGENITATMAEEEEVPSGNMCVS